MCSLTPRDGVARPPPCPATWLGAPPRNKGLRYPADPPSVEEIVSVMRHAGDSVYGARSRALIVVLWRAGLQDQRSARAR